MAENITPTSNQVKTNGKWVAKNASAAADTLQSKAVEGMQHAYDAAVETASDVLDTVTASRPVKLARQYPIQSAAIGGLAVGFLMGAIFLRRSK